MISILGEKMTDVLLSCDPSLISEIEPDTHKDIIKRL